MDFERIFENKKGVEKDINNEVELNRRDANIKVSDMFETIFKGIFSEKKSKHERIGGYNIVEANYVNAVITGMINRYPVKLEATTDNATTDNATPCNIKTHGSIKPGFYRKKKNSKTNIGDVISSNVYDVSYINENKMIPFIFALFGIVLCNDRFYIDLNIIFYYITFILKHEFKNREVDVFYSYHKEFIRIHGDENLLNITEWSDSDGFKKRSNVFDDDYISSLTSEEVEELSVKGRLSFVSIPGFEDVDTNFFKGVMKFVLPGTKSEEFFSLEENAVVAMSKSEMITGQFASDSVLRFEKNKTTGEVSGLGRIYNNGIKYGINNSDIDIDNNSENICQMVDDKNNRKTHSVLVTGEGFVNFCKIISMRYKSKTDPEYKGFDKEVATRAIEIINLFSTSISGPGGIYDYCSKKLVFEKTIIHPMMQQLIAAYMTETEVPVDFSINAFAELKLKKEIKNGHRYSKTTMMYYINSKYPDINKTLQSGLPHYAYEKTIDSEKRFFFNDGRDESAERVCDVVRSASYINGFFEVMRCAMTKRIGHKASLFEDEAFRRLGIQNFVSYFNKCEKVIYNVVSLLSIKRNRSGCVSHAVNGEYLPSVFLSGQGDMYFDAEYTSNEYSSFSVENMIRSDCDKVGFIGHCVTFSLYNSINKYRSNFGYVPGGSRLDANGFDLNVDIEGDGELARYLRLLHEETIKNSRSEKKNLDSEYIDRLLSKDIKPMSYEEYEKFVCYGGDGDSCCVEDACVKSEFNGYPEAEAEAEAEAETETESYIDQEEYNNDEYSEEDRLLDEQISKAMWNVRNNSNLIGIDNNDICSDGYKSHNEGSNCDINSDINNNVFENEGDDLIDIEEAKKDRKRQIMIQNRQKMLQNGNRLSYTQSNINLEADLNENQFTAINSGVVKDFIENRPIDNDIFEDGFDDGFEEFSEENCNGNAATDNEKLSKAFESSDYQKLDISSVVDAIMLEREERFKSKIKKLYGGFDNESNIETGFATKRKELLNLPGIIKNGIPILTYNEIATEDDPDFPKMGKSRMKNGGHSDEVIKTHEDIISNDEGLLSDIDGLGDKRPSAFNAIEKAVDMKLQTEKATVKLRGFSKKTSEKLEDTGCIRDDFENIPPAILKNLSNEDMNELADYIKEQTRMAALEYTHEFTETISLLSGALSSISKSVFETQNMVGELSHNFNSKISVSYDVINNRITKLQRMFHDSLLINEAAAHVLVGSELQKPMYKTITTGVVPVELTKEVTKSFNTGLIKTNQETVIKGSNMITARAIAAKNTLDAHVEKIYSGAYYRISPEVCESINDFTYRVNVKLQVMILALMTLGYIEIDKFSYVHTSSDIAVTVNRLQTKIEQECAYKPENLLVRITTAGMRRICVSGGLMPDMETNGCPAGDLMIDSSLDMIIKEFALVYRFNTNTNEKKSVGRQEGSLV